MIVIEVCRCNLDNPEVKDALETLRLVAEGRAEVKEVDCVESCKDCAEDLLVARIGEHLFTGSHNAEVIYKIEKHLIALCTECNDE